MSKFRFYNLALRISSEAIQGVEMFGHNDDQAVMGSSTVQNPSMLDNVSTQDFQSPDPTQVATTPAPTDPVQNTTTSDDHHITTDNPFVQSPVEAQVATNEAAPEENNTPIMPTAEEPASTASSSSGPVAPPVVSEDDSQDQTSYIAALSDSDNTTNTAGPIDHDKLADIKQQALAHLEPLADHVGGTPEETFKTTMMMIQANDNHTLLDKALAAAKDISDDKERAQAMLDIINEINYFSQAGLAE